MFCKDINIIMDHFNRGYTVLIIPENKNISFALFYKSNEKIYCYNRSLDFFEYPKNIDNLKNHFINMINEYGGVYISGYEN